MRGGVSVSEPCITALWDEAFAWCCHQRRHHPPGADIWDLRFHWSSRREALLVTVRAGRYRLRPVRLVGHGAQRRAVWDAADALVLKWVALRLRSVLPVHPLCEHVKGLGGGQRSVRKMAQTLREDGWRFVCRTDIRGFYGHIRHGLLYRQLRRHVADPVLLDLLKQFLHYSVEWGGEFHAPRKGISRGCALSPLLAGFCLWGMDTYFEAQPDLRYVRYMDDFVILTRTRWKLRRAVKALSVFFARGGYERHPEKTFIGRISRGFDWMGIMFNVTGVTGVAPRALSNHRERCRRLYERGMRRGKKTALHMLSGYVKRWKIWRESMLNAWKIRWGNTVAAPPVALCGETLTELYVPIHGAGSRHDSHPLRPSGPGRATRYWLIGLFAICVIGRSGEVQSSQELAYHSTIQPTYRSYYATPQALLPDGPAGGGVLSAIANPVVSTTGKVITLYSTDHQPFDPARIQIAIGTGLSTGVGLMVENTLPGSIGGVQLSDHAIHMSLGKTVANWLGGPYALSLSRPDAVISCSGDLSGSGSTADTRLIPGALGWGGKITLRWAGGAWKNSYTLSCSMSISAPIEVYTYGNYGVRLSGNSSTAGALFHTGALGIVIGFADRDRPIALSTWLNGIDSDGGDDCNVDGMLPCAYDFARRKRATFGGGWATDVDGRNPLNASASCSYSPPAPDIQWPNVDMNTAASSTIGGPLHGAAAQTATLSVQCTGTSVNQVAVRASGPSSETSDSRFGSSNPSVDYALAISSPGGHSVPIKPNTIAQYKWSDVVQPTGGQGTDTNGNLNFTVTPIWAPGPNTPGTARTMLTIDVWPLVE